MKVTEEAIEAAAQAIASANLRNMPWSRMNEETRNHFRRDAKAALDGALPHLMGA